MMAADGGLLVLTSDIRDVYRLSSNVKYLSGYYFTALGLLIYEVLNT